MRWFFTLLALAACEPMPTSGNPFQPVRPASKAPAVTPVGEDPGGFDFEGEDRQPDDNAGDDGLGALALQAQLLGIPASELEAPAPAPVAPEPSLAAPVASVAPPALWDPSAPVPDGGWGVRLIGTLPEVQPPRAVLALADGREVVVTAGDLLPDQRIVVMAVGRHAVQIAEITPQGFYAEVRTQTLPLLFGGGTAAAATPAVP